MDERRIGQPGSNSVALLYPTTGAALIERARPKNRAMAAGFGVFVVTVFATAILVGVLYNISEPIGTKLEARDRLSEHAVHEATLPTLR